MSWQQLHKGLCTAFKVADKELLAELNCASTADGLLAEALGRCEGAVGLPHRRIQTCRADGQQQTRLCFPQDIHGPSTEGPRIPGGPLQHGPLATSSSPLQIILAISISRSPLC